MATPSAHSAKQISAAPASAVNSCLSELSRPGRAGNCTTRPGQGGRPPKAHTYAGVGGRLHSGHKATLHLHKCSHSLERHLLAMWSWSRSWEKPTAVSAAASTPVSALHCFLVTAWPSTATAHGLVTAGAGEGPGPASPAVSPSPSPCPPLWTASFGGPGSSQRVALEPRGWSAGSEGHF